MATLVNARDRGLPLPAAAADVAVTLDLTPEVPHVFQNFHAILGEALDALDRAGRLLTAHLADAARASA